MANTLEDILDRYPLKDSMGNLRISEDENGTVSVSAHQLAAMYQDAVANCDLTVSVPAILNALLAGGSDARGHTTLFQDMANLGVIQ